MVLSIEFNHIMQMLNKIRIDSAKAQGYAISFFAFSVSGLFITLTITVKNNFQYGIFTWYFFIMGFVAMVLTWVKVKNVKRKFFDIMAGIEKLKRGQKGE